MKMKYYVGISVFLLISTTVLANISSGVNQKPTQLPAPPQLYTHIINVGIDSSEQVLDEGYGSNKESFNRSLNYSWIVDNQQYRFIMEEFNMTLLENYSNITKYNVIIYAGPHDEELPFAFNISDPMKMKTNLRNYIQYYCGGWVGHCYGAILPINVSHDPITSLEWLWNRYRFLNWSFCQTRDDAHIGLPMIDEYLINFLPLKKIRLGLKWDNPELICQNTPVWYTGTNVSNFSHLHLQGMHINVTVTDHSHPIFKDYLNDTWLVAWGGGPGLVIPAGDNNVSRLSSFPSTLPQNPYIVWKLPLASVPLNLVTELLHI